MEISKPQIARLVLGYLKSENCEGAFNEFLLKSQYLKSLAVFVKNGKYFATRVGGLTLEDILAEYSEISLAIQGMLEQTDYYEKEHKTDKTKLSTQLFYIIDHNSRSSSPILPKHLNTTPSESLPGNSVSTCNKSSGISEDGMPPGFHNISNTSTSHKDDKRTAMAELDNQMKKIEEKKEQDPAFDEILKEIIGHKNAICTNSSTSRSHSDKNQTAILNAANTDNPSNSRRSGEQLKNSEVIVVDSYVNKPNPVPSSQQNQYILTNTPAGLLMVPSVMGAQNYILVNSGPAATSTPMGAVLTDNDIMKMPTLIIDDSSSARTPLMSVPQLPRRPVQPPIMTQSQIILSSSTPHLVTTQPKTMTQTTQCSKRVKTLVPRTDKITVSSTDGGYYKVFDEKGQVVSDKKISEVETSQISAQTSQISAETSQISVQDPPVLRRRSLRNSKNRNLKETQNTEISPDRSPSKTVTVDSSKKESRKSAKNLFKENKNDTRKDVWDSDLRELLIPNAESKKSKTKFDTSENMDSSDDRLDTTDNQLDVTCDDEELKKGALMIEASFKTPVKTPKPQEDKEEPVQEENVLPVETKEGPTKEATELVEEGVKTSDSSEDVIKTEETEVYLRNCNGPPRFKKKCNETNNAMDIYEVEVVEDNTQEDSIAETVEMKQEPGSSQARKSIVLETPVKGGIPKTPGKFEMTPFTKVLEEQLQGMDLLSLSTPMMTITPSFPITPNVNLVTPDHHSNRPTDYSTSSSYYQPSDTEQNKSIESLMEDYRKEDGRKMEEVKIEEDIVDAKEMAVTEQLKRMFNENVIGKKNLNIMKQEDAPCLDSSSSSNSSDSSSGSSNDSDSDSDDSISKMSNTSSPKRTYSLRKKRSPVPKTPNEVKTKKTTPKAANKILSVQQEIQEKKERTIRAIKKGNDETVNKIKKLPPRQKNGRFLSLKKTVNPSDNMKEISEKCDVENEITDDDFALHLSTDEDSTNKINSDTAIIKINSDTVINKIKEENNSKTNNTDEPATQEANQLVQDLSERGIYLVPKVSQRNPDPCSDSRKASSDDENKLENLEVSSEENSLKDGSTEEASNSFRNPIDVTFDIQDFGEDEQIKFVYDYSKRRKKKVYNLELLERSIQADVYIESLDIDIVRLIKCTPTHSILDHKQKKPPVRRRKSVKPENKPVPLKDISQPTKVETNAENKDKCEKQNAKDPEPKRSPQKRPKTAETKTPKKKSETKSQQNPETTNSESTETKNHKKSTKSPKKSEMLDAKSVKKSHPKRLKSVDDNLKTIDESNKEEMTVDTVPFEEDNVERTVIDRFENREEEKISDIGSQDDDLMNFAVLGNVAEEESGSSCKGRDKRKLSSDGENLHPEKKIKTENEKNRDLLNNIDVDSFLNKVHGDKPT